LHQFLGDEVGLSALRQHLWQTIGIGNASIDKQEFDRAFPEAIPKGNPDLPSISSGARSRAEEAEGRIASA
jgi:hypothetical protein